MNADEFAVVDDQGYIAGMKTHTTLVGAEVYLQWLTGERRDEMRAEAEAEAAHEAATGDMSNAARFRWRKEEPRTYRLMRREVSEWAEVEKGIS